MESPVTLSHAALGGARTLVAGRSASVWASLGLVRRGRASRAEIVAGGAEEVGRPPLRPGWRTPILPPLISQRHLIGERDRGHILVRSTIHEHLRCRGVFDILRQERKQPQAAMLG